jgi:guanylate kinase
LNEETVLNGITFVISAPSGTGKTTVCGRLLAHDAKLRFSVSHTTRAPRTGEVEGENYHFVDESEFERLKAEGAFLESARYTGNLYGTSLRSVNDLLDAGFDVLLEIEVQGASLIRKSDFEAVFIFLLPPSMEILEQRLRDRGTDSKSKIEQRLREGNPEIAMARIFDYAVINDDLDTAVGEVQEIIRAEREGATRDVHARFGLEHVLEGWQSRVRAPDAARD